MLNTRRTFKEDWLWVYKYNKTTNQPSPSFSPSVLTHPFPCRTHLQKPTVADPVKKSLAFIACMFTVFFKARRLSLFWTRWIQHTPSVLSSTRTPLCLWFCDGNLVCIARLFCNMLREVIIVITSGYKCRLWRSLAPCNNLHSPVIPNIFITPSCFSLHVTQPHRANVKTISTYF
jgi:hypothetical protein